MSTAQGDLAARKRELLRRRLADAGLANSGAERIPPRPADEPIPLSFAQARMWFLQQLDPDSPAYNVCLAITLRGPLDVPALRSAFHQLVVRHEVLRTRYVSTADDVPTQEIDTPPPVDLPVVDLRELPQAERRERTDELARRYAAAPFDLSRDHPMRVSLIHRDTNEYVLVLTVHHIAWDGGTFNALSADLSALYRAALRDEPANLDPLPVQYADAACWQRRKWTDDYLDEHLQYWSHELIPEPDPLPLPIDGQRRAVPDERGGRRMRDFGPETTERITAYCQYAGLTPFMVLYAGFASLLHRYTGSDDVPIGSATMNRDVAGLERLIGNFGNTLVLRADVSGDPTFAELVRRVQRVCADGYAHQDMPFDKLVDELRPQRHQGRSVLFDVMLLFLTQGLRGPEFPGVHADWETVHNDTCQFDLALEAFMTGGRLRIEATYRAELFESDTVDRLLAHLETLLAAAIDEPDRPVSALEMLSAHERDLILRRWNDTTEPMPPATLLELFEAQARATPRHTAVEYGETSLSYAELNALANQLARRLVRLGVGPERCVGVHLERSVEMAVGLLAVLKAGGAFVPVEPSWPAPRISEVSRSADLVALLTAPGSTPDAGVPLVEVELGEVPPDEPDLDIRVDPEALAYVIYTSGSTGAPKGAAIRHRAIAHRLVWQRGVLGGFGTDDASLFKAPLGFDISINEVFLPLVTGGRLVIAEPGGQRDNEYLLELIDRHRVTFIYIPSSMLDLLLQLDDFGTRASSLKHVWCGGEVLTPELFDRFRARSHAVMYHGYGPAEATIGVSHVVYRTNEIRSAVSIGRPNTNTRLYVLDRALRPVPLGVAGELYAGGVYLARGYVNDPGRTAQHFVADPFGPPGQRLYRTGDLARWRPDGELEFLGRADNQVKIRGMRVELEEIEAILEQHPRVRRSVVVVREDAPGMKRLVGYCLPQGELESGDVLDWARGRLPEHMVPQALLVLPEFPLMPSGKVDRKNLPEPEFRAAAPSRSPETEREKVLCGLFAEVLGLPAVGVDDNFFQLGGDSIVSVQLVGKARKAGVVFTPRQVFEHPTPEGLATFAGDLADAEREPDELAFGGCELTPIMRWVRAASGSFGALNQTVQLVTPAGLSTDGLAATLQAVLDRHDALRARLEDGQLVIPQPGALRATDILTRVEGLPADTGELTDTALAARGRLDPAAGRLVVAVWFDAGEPASGRLLVVAHHLAVDWVSWSVLSNDLAQAWRTGGSELPRSGSSFRRWTQVLAEAATDARRVGELEYWARTLDGADRDAVHRDVLERSPDPGRDVTKTLRTAQLALPPDRARALLTELPAAYYTGVPEVLLTGLAIAMAHGPDDRLLVGLEGHGREEHIGTGIDLSGTVGWFTSYYPVLLDLGDIEPGQALAGGAAAGAALKRIKERVREVPDRGIGYGMLRHLNPETAATLAALPEPAMSFNYLGRFGAQQAQPWQLAPETATFRLPPEDDHPVRVALDVNAMAVESDDGTWLDITVAWPDAVTSRARVDELLEHWDRALRALAEHAVEPDAGGHTPSDLPLVELTQDDIDELENDG